MRVLLGSVIVLAAASSGAEARKVYYEINGKRYSYSSNNQVEAAQARDRMAAAKAAKAAKAKADEEISQHPLVRALSSTTQREARQAQEKLDKLLTESPPADASPKPSSERWANLKDRRADHGKAEPESKTAPAAAPQTVAVVVAEPPRAVPVLVAPPPPPPPVAEPVNSSQRTKIRSISFDVETGIKTTVMIDGVIEEEPFDSGVLAHIAPEHEQANSLAAFVKKLRKSASQEATGSITAGAVPSAR